MIALLLTAILLHPPPRPSPVPSNSTTVLVFAVSEMADCLNGPIRRAPGDMWVATVCQPGQVCREVWTVVPSVPCGRLDLDWDQDVDLRDVALLLSKMKKPSRREVSATLLFRDVAVFISKMTMP